MRQSRRSIFLRALLLLGGLGLVVGAAFVPVPPDMTRVRTAAVLVGILLYMTVLTRPFHQRLPHERKYIALREETERLLVLVRELNRAARQAEAIGYREDGYLEPIVQRLHEQVDRLPLFAGETGQVTSGDPPHPIH